MVERATRAGDVRTATVWAALQAELDRSLGRWRVLDAGGGTGGFAVPLAELGHLVTVVDPSPDSLAALQRRADDAGVRDRVVGVQGDLAGLPEIVAALDLPGGGFDLVLAHSVLEVVDDLERAVAHLAAALVPGGAASVLAAGRIAAVLARVALGRLAEARRALDDRGGRWGMGDGGRRFDRAELEQLLTGAGLRVESVYGVRVFADLAPAGVAEAERTALIDLELAVADRPAYRDIATQLHLLARRP